MAVFIKAGFFMACADGFTRSLAGLKSVLNSLYSVLSQP